MPHASGALCGGSDLSTYMTRQAHNSILTLAGHWSFGLRRTEAHDAHCSPRRMLVPNLYYLSIDSRYILRVLEKATDITAQFEWEKARAALSVLALRYGPAAHNPGRSAQRCNVYRTI